MIDFKKHLTEEKMIVFDGHVHSCFSSRPTNWLTRKLNFPESYTKPEHIYRTAIDRGMTHVTITDHNEIRGALEIMKYPNTFISSEITTRFPDNQCKIHVLIYDITENQYREILDARKNIYELVDYLKTEHIYHAVAHPMYSINDKLTPEHFERLLVLFDIFELNGSKSREVNDSLQFLIQNLTVEILGEIAAKYNVSGNTDPLLKGFISGSDDHSGIHIAHTCTTNHDDLSAIFTHCRNNICRGFNSDPHRLAYNIYSIGYQYLNGKLDIEQYITKDLSIQIIDKLLTNRQEETPGILSTFIGTVRSMKSQRNGSRSVESSLSKAVIRMSELANGTTTMNRSDRWFNLVSTAINESSRDLIDYTFDELLKGNLFNLFRGIGSLLSLYILMAPYYISYYVFQETKDFARNLDLMKRLAVSRPRDTHVAHFTDTFYDVSGVVRTLHNMAHCSRKYDKKLTFVTCSHNKSIMGEKVFKPIHSFNVPEYPELEMHCPPILEVMNYCYESDFTHFHVATPGPMGLVALLMAKIFKKPVYSTYHTAFPQYAGALLGSTLLEDATWKYMLWFYNSMDMILLPSEAFGQELAEKGIDKNKLRLMPRGIDTKRFIPPKNYGGRNGVFNILYVGRVSREKNLDILAEAFRRISHDKIRLTIVGDGPYRNELESALEGYNVEFTGYLEGEDLIQSYHNADLFVFPSTTDTFGNVVLEAQACGVPVIVTDIGGPRENIIEGKTGWIVKGNCVDALCDGIKRSLNRTLLTRMSNSAHAYAKGRDFDKAFLETWDYYSEIPLGT